jgi:hypothetical protein
MFRRLRQRIRDIRTISALFRAAERHANADGQREPGSEHFVLAALELPDGTARRAFERLHADPDGFRAAIDRQYEEALRNIGIELPASASPAGSPTAIPPGRGLYKAKASVQTLMQALARRLRAKPGDPLLGAHLIVAALAAQYGVTVRALHSMGVEPEALAAAAQAEIDAALATEKLAS